MHVLSWLLLFNFGMAVHSKTLLALLGTCCLFHLMCVWRISRSSPKRFYPLPMKLHLATCQWAWESHVPRMGHPLCPHFPCFAVIWILWITIITITLITRRVLRRCGRICSWCFSCILLFLWVLWFRWVFGAWLRNTQVPSRGSPQTVLHCLGSCGILLSLLRLGDCQRLFGGWLGFNCSSWHLSLITWFGLKNRMALNCPVELWPWQSLSAITFLYLRNLGWGGDQLLTNLLSLLFCLPKFGLCRWHCCGFWI